MGARGPVPKRENQRRRTNSPKAESAPAGPRADALSSSGLAEGNTRAQLVELAVAAGVTVPKSWSKGRIADAILEAAANEGPDPEWHPVAARWFESLSRSGQSAFYEPSDWATAWLLAEAMSRELKPIVLGVNSEGDLIKASLPVKGASMTAWLKAMNSLLVTEGDRRRVQLELARPKPADEAETTEAVPDGVAMMSKYRGRTG